MIVSPYIAHLKQGKSCNEILKHELKEHLIEVAKKAGQYASKFSSEEWGYILGLSHDLGKARSTWQEYLLAKAGFAEDAHLENVSTVEKHAIYGAKVLYQKLAPAYACILSYAVAGHHAGLPDFYQSENIGRAALNYQLSQDIDLTEIPESFFDLIKDTTQLVPPFKFNNEMEISFWIRMLYSCLVDADFLDTETFMDPSKSALRHGFKEIEDLAILFEKHYKNLEAYAPETIINRLRKEIKEKCIKNASLKQGVFTLTVPTGGGKTLSSMAFALEHAKKHNLDRIIYVIPYTSIIEQNAMVFKNIFGKDQVVEHHSNLADSEQDNKGRLATENWDAPVIVTTTVQFFESLFANRVSKTRKLHNIVNSVIIMDEAQLLPTKYLKPILEALKILVKQYGVTLLITTATQPAFNQNAAGIKTFEGFENVTEIIGGKNEVDHLFQILSRVKIKLPKNFAEKKEYAEIAQELQKYSKVLCIVSDRKSCREIHALMPEGTYHLSALMCPEHRTDIIDEIKKALKEKDVVRVISTQLIEAGVDIDFPVVFRALAGMDSIIQAAGRCNREGILEKGMVKVFIPPRLPPPGILRKAAEQTEIMLMGMQEMPQEPLLFQQYFERLYWLANDLDEKEIVELLTPKRDKNTLAIAFKTAADRFTLIENEQKSLIVKYKSSEEFIDRLIVGGPNRSLVRQLQRYSVSIYSQDFMKMLTRGSIKEVYPDFYVLVSDVEYSKEKGVIIEAEFDPEKFML